MKKKITLVRKIRYVESYTYNLVKAREVLYEESLSHTLETRRVEIPTKGSRERRDETRTNIAQWVVHDTELLYL